MRRSSSAVVRDDLDLTRAQVSNTVIASVAITIVARLVIGRVIDHYGPRRTYTALLALGALPVIGIGLAQSYETFLLFRLAIGAVGAAFVITQYHSSVMFAANVVGTANATTAGWGNLGGGVTQIVTPLVLAGFVALGASETAGWRLTMVVPGVALLFTAVAYYRFTRDTPDGDFRDLRAAGRLPPAAAAGGSFRAAASDPRVWALFLIYGACFGVELTVNNIAALYYHDRFGLGLTAAGLYGLMNVFARPLGGIISDRAGAKWGLRGRVRLLGLALALEGLALVLFSRMGVVSLALPAMVVFAVLVQLSSGATYAVVPFVNRRAFGSVAGIVGAGGNAGAVAAGFLFRAEGLAIEDGFLTLGLLVVLASALVFAVRFSPATEAAERRTLGRALDREAEAARSAIILPVMPSERASRIRRCRGCKRPVGETAADAGYCKRCLKAARDGDPAPRYVDLPDAKRGTP